MSNRTKMNDTLKFVWAYMIEYGRITTGKWSYYGGDWDSPSGLGWTEAEKRYKTFRDKIQRVGVDWNKTVAPTSSTRSAFTDTFHDAEQVETLLGSIILTDGSEYMLGVSNAEVRFSNYVKLLSDLAEDSARVKNILGE